MKMMVLTSFLLSAIIYAAIALLLNIKVYDINTCEPYIHRARKYLGDIKGNITVRQCFVSEKNNLCRIDLSIAREFRRHADDVSARVYLNVLRSFLKKRKHGLCQFELYDENNKLLFKHNFDVALIDDKKYMPIYFAPITNSANNKYYFKISERDPDTLSDLSLVLGQAVRAENKLYLNELCMEGISMTFMTYASPKYINYDTLLDRISQYKPSFIKKKFLYLVIYLYGVVHAFLILYLIRIMVISAAADFSGRITPS